MAILTREDHDFFAQNGYVVVPGAVPKENLDATIAAIWDFLGMDPNDPEDWYRSPLRVGGMIELYHHQALWDNRQYPKVHQAFAEILGTPELWVSFDRASMKPPQHPSHPEYDHKGFVHWDVDTTNPPGQTRVQGVLYLADTAADQGGFQCVPELYAQFESWVKNQPADRNPRQPDLTGFQVKPIPGKAGDLLIWNVMLPHGNGHNVSQRPRLAQYISMRRARPDDEATIHARVEQWQKRLHPTGRAFPGDPRRIEETSGTTAELTPLGRKLLGIDRW